MTDADKPFPLPIKQQLLSELLASLVIIGDLHWQQEVWSYRDKRYQDAYDDRMSDIFDVLLSGGLLDEDLTDVGVSDEERSELKVLTGKLGEFYDKYESSLSEYASDVSALHRNTEWLEVSKETREALNGFRDLPSYPKKQTSDYNL